MTEFIQIGYNGVCSKDKIVAVVSPDSAPIRRMIQETRERKYLIDASAGHKTRSVIVMKSNHVVLSALEVSEIYEALGAEEA